MTNKPGPIVIVTGSRDWTDSITVHVEILRKNPFCLVLGDCETGADAMARTWAMLHDIPADINIADWDNQGDAAGPIRNTAMIRSALQIAEALDMSIEDIVCLGFPLPQSKGTHDCMRKARRAGIHVDEFRPWGIRK